MKKIVFITGTRADYGKLKTLIRVVEATPGYEPYIYVTGMHMLKRYGYTAQEVLKDGYFNIYMNINQHVGDHMEVALANTVKGVSHYIHEIDPDLIVVHGDRLEALAGSIVGAFTNTLVAHVEGGELSGTIDDSIRHSISKMSHVHFVCNDEAFDRLHRMGESRENIYVIGSPDYDVMFNSKLPVIDDVLNYYEIPFKEYGIVLFHPVTTEAQHFSEYSRMLVEAVNRSGKNFIAVYPNNDEGSEYIIKAYEEFNSDKVKVFPSLSFERFIVLLKNCSLMVGNSSAGIREAPCYGIPTINIGDRQNKRFKHKSILDVDYETDSLLLAIQKHWGLDYSDCRVNQFGSGDSAEKFISCLNEGSIWKTSIQKVAFDD